MKYCQYCGKEIMNEAVICPGCGCPVQNSNDSQKAMVDETVSPRLVALAVLIPLFGIIYWPVMAKSRPKCALICGITSIVAWVVWFFLLNSMIS